MALKVVNIIRSFMTVIVALVFADIVGFLLVLVDISIMAVLVKQDFVVVVVVVLVLNDVDVVVLLMLLFMVLHS